MDISKISSTQYLTNFKGAERTIAPVTPPDKQIEDGVKKLTSALSALASYGIRKVKSENKQQGSEEVTQYWEEPGVLIKKSKNENGEEVKERIYAGKVQNKEVTLKTGDSGQIVYSYNSKGDLSVTEETNFCGNKIVKYYNRKGCISSKSVITKSCDGGFEEKTYDENNKLKSAISHIQTHDGYEEYCYNGEGELLSKRIMSETNNGNVNEKTIAYYRPHELTHDLKLSAKEIETTYPYGKKVYQTDSYDFPQHHYKRITTKNNQGGETSFFYNDGELVEQTETSANTDRINLKSVTYNGCCRLTEKSECFEDGTSIRTKYIFDCYKGKSIPDASFTYTPDGKTITEHFDKNGKKKKDKTVQYKENDNQIFECYDEKGNLETKNIITKNGVSIREQYNEQGEVTAKKISN